MLLTIKKPGLRVGNYFPELDGYLDRDKEVKKICLTKTQVDKIISALNNSNFLFNLGFLSFVDKKDEANNKFVKFIIHPHPIAQSYSSKNLPDDKPSQILELKLLHDTVSYYPLLNDDCHILTKGRWH